MPDVTVTLTVPAALVSGLNAQLEARVPAPQIPANPAKPDAGMTDDPAYRAEDRIDDYFHQLLAAELNAVKIRAANQGVEDELAKDTPDAAVLKTHLMAKKDAFASKATSLEDVRAARAARP